MRGIATPTADVSPPVTAPTEVVDLTAPVEGGPPAEVSPDPHPGYPDAMRLLPVLFLGMACSDVCGSGEYLVQGGDPALVASVDPDGDGYAEAYEQCGVLFGSFGLRSGGETTLFISPTLDASRVESFEVETTTAPTSQLVVPDAALEPGARVDATGTASHRPNLDDPTFRATVILDEGWVEVLGRRNSGRSVSEVSSNAVEWRLRWEATYVDPQDETTVIQRIQGEDWIEVLDD